MKVKHLLLGIAVVALMAACGKKESTETTTVVPAEETVEPQPEKQSAEQPVKKAEPAKPAAKSEAVKDEPAKPSVNPCEQVVKDYESYANELKAASNDKIGAEKLKRFAELKKQNAAKEASVKDCLNDETYGRRAKTAMMSINQVLTK